MTVPSGHTPAPWTCQICGREIKAKSGLISHHGYKRPNGQGWQTASCSGARHVPYEVGHDALDAAILEQKYWAADVYPARYAGIGRIEQFDITASRNYGRARVLVGVVSRDGTKIVTTADYYTVKAIPFSPLPTFADRLKSTYAALETERRERAEFLAYLTGRRVAWRAPEGRAA